MQILCIVLVVVCAAEEEARRCGHVNSGTLNISLGVVINSSHAIGTELVQVLDCDRIPAAIILTILHVIDELLVNRIGFAPLDHIVDLCRALPVRAVCIIEGLEALTVAGRVLEP